MELLVDSGQEDVASEHTNLIAFHPTSFFTQGEITIELYTEHAPKTCKNFYELVTRIHILNASWRIALGNGVVVLITDPMASTTLIFGSTQR